MSEWWSTAGGVQSALREEIKARDDRIEELETKLAKAVDFIEDLLSGRDRDDDWRIEACTTLAELKGENDEH